MADRFLPKEVDSSNDVSRNDNILFGYGNLIVR